jgi:hypothetical protein
MYAVSADLSPLFGDAGLWMVKQYSTRQAEKGNDEKKRKARVLTEIIESFNAHGMDNLGKESKYNMLNRFSPKKMANRKVNRHEVKHIYSWIHYGPQ